MLNVSTAFKEAMVAPVRRFSAIVSGTDAEAGGVFIYTHEDVIKSIEIQRVGNDSKFYGYGICQRLNLKLVDLQDIIQPAPNSALTVAIGILLPDGEIEYVNWPTFYISERHRSEEDGELSITAYDKLDEAGLYPVSVLGLEKPYTVQTVIEAIAAYLGLNDVIYTNIPTDDYALTLSYEDGANIDGTETLREMLNYCAEAVSAIYYIDNNNALKFKRLDVSGEPVATITEEDYFTLEHGDNRRISAVMHVTDLGDNVSATTGVTGTTAYIRNNPFWDNRDDIADIVEYALSCVGGLTINQYDCSWRGNLPLEVGDKIEMKQVGMDNYTESGYVVDDVITFDGSFGQKTQWSYNASDAQTEGNSSTLGEVISETIARVDKVNKTITLLASEVEASGEKSSALEVGTQTISGTVTELSKYVDETIEGINQELATIRETANAALTKDEFLLEFDKEISDGVNKVVTTTGYSFDEEGLTVSKTGSDIETTITEDGMTVYRSGDSVLVVNNEGVKAEDLHATTYLIIGANSRFEDWTSNGEPRTGCFFVGGES